MNTYSTGVMNRLSTVERIIPPNTAVPSELRAALPAPDREHQRRDAQDERDRGHEDRPQPRLGGALTAVTASTPCSRIWLANSTIRIAFFDASPISIT